MVIHCLFPSLLIPFLVSRPITVQSIVDAEVGLRHASLAKGQDVGVSSLVYSCTWQWVRGIFGAASWCVGLCVCVFFFSKHYPACFIAPRLFARSSDLSRRRVHVQARAQGPGRARSRDGRAHLGLPVAHQGPGALHGGHPAERVDHPPGAYSTTVLLVSRVQCHVAVPHLVHALTHKSVPLTLAHTGAGAGRLQRAQEGQG